MLKRIRRNSLAVNGALTRDGNRDAISIGAQNRPRPGFTPYACGGEALAIGAERHAPDSAGVPLEGEGFLPGPGVPQLHRLVLSGGSEPLAVGAERHAADGIGVPAESHLPRGDLSLPVEPLETSAIDAALVGWKLLDKPSLKRFNVSFVPVPLDDVHSGVVQTLLVQFGLGLAPSAFPLSVGEGREGRLADVVFARSRSPPVSSL